MYHPRGGPGFGFTLAHAAQAAQDAGQAENEKAQAGLYPSEALGLSLGGGFRDCLAGDVRTAAFWTYHKNYLLKVCAMYLKTGTYIRKCGSCFWVKLQLSSYHK